jgi:predicted RNA-binding Zn-ribbon protein involved in translation (DUF1610 family)
VNKGIMQTQSRFSLLRKILTALGLSPEATEDIIERIADFLSEKGDKSDLVQEYPYFIREDFLSHAERSFLGVLQMAVGKAAVICPKVSLGDLFFVKDSDPSRFRTFTNKIDRKHVDFLLCDPKTLSPLVGLELDDKSHQLEDRILRDEFVGNVFSAAKLPLVHIPAKNGYSVSELSKIVAPYLQTYAPDQPKVVINSPTEPICPKCGAKMVLRTAKSGPNQGKPFWGCPNYPKCRGILEFTEGE